MSRHRSLIPGLLAGLLATLAGHLPLGVEPIAVLPPAPAGLAAGPRHPPAADDPLGFVKEELHMGVRFRISLYCATPAAAAEAFEAAFGEISRLEQVFSDYRDNSETRQLDLAPLEMPLPLSPDMLALLQRSLELQRQTDGYFDVTLGTLTKLWRAARRARQPPAAEDLAHAKSRVGMALLELTDAGMLIKRPPGYELDFGGVAKGYTADQVLRLLREKFGVTRVLVDASGDLVAGDPPPGKRGWLVGLARPANESGPLQRIFLANQALAGSGDANQFLEVDQTRWSHLLDPLRREPIVGQNLTLVLAPDGATADALASALSVCPTEKFLRILAATPGVDAKRYRKAAADRDLEVMESPHWTKRTLALAVTAPRDLEER